jgi:hypothetical protein
MIKIFLYFRVKFVGILDELLLLPFFLSYLFPIFLSLWSLEMPHNCIPQLAMKSILQLQMQ